ncbi:hypothetical protein VHEMI07668 [[Torrubiella] hemipterigena]|uniref:N-acetyltransferase domain-containing protein n=1 Tax=[Torrubiella] hemipterigena TaxID=1531966 RepID=A0A0A1TNB8_9HYPO|nr:hypothetical protein VHEMI07668 [[Torrubiella] hemipterigena]
MSFSIVPVTVDDVTVLAKISGSAMEKDRQTEMKALAEDPFDMEAYTLESLPGLLLHPRVAIVKAVDYETGEVMGMCQWGFRGFAPNEMPVLEGQPKRVDDAKKPAEADAPEDAPREETTAEAEEKTKSEPEPTKQGKDKVKDLVALTDADLDAWMEEQMPEGTRCLYIVGLTVSPKFQGRGVGSALLKWGTSVCDANGVFAWVHSSMGAWQMYQKSGFEVVRTLDVDLDVYAPCPPPGEGEGAKWGIYTFYYMKYLPKKVD